VVNIKRREVVNLGGISNFLSNNRTESEVKAGILTQTEDNLLLWSEQPVDKIKKLNEKAGAFWYRDR